MPGQDLVSYLDLVNPAPALPPCAVSHQFGLAREAGLAQLTGIARHSQQIAAAREEIPRVNNAPALTRPSAA